MLNKVGAWNFGGVWMYKVFDLSMCMNLSIDTAEDGSDNKKCS